MLPASSERRANWWGVGRGRGRGRERGRGEGQERKEAQSVCLYQDTAVLLQ